MAGNYSTFIQVPSNVDDPMVLKRFLDKLIQELDVAFGNRGDSRFAKPEEMQGFVENTSFENELAELNAKLNSMQEEIDRLKEVKLPFDINDYMPKDGSEDFTGIVSYDTNKVFTNGKQLVSKNYVDFMHPTQPAIYNLQLVISDPPTPDEIYTIIDKLHETLTALRDSRIIEPATEPTP